MTVVNIPDAAIIAWAPGAVYAAGACVVSNGLLYQNQTGSAFISAATWSLDASKWTALTAAGTELGYAEVDAPQTGIAAGGTDITGLAVSFVAPARPVMIELFVPFLYPTTAGNCAAYICEGAPGTTPVVPVSQANAYVVSGAISSALIVKRHYAAGVLTAGQTFQFYGHAAAPSGATAELYADPTYPAYLHVVQL